MKQADWKEKLQQLIPSFGQSLAKDAELTAKMRERSAAILGLNEKEELAV